MKIKLTEDVVIPVELIAEEGEDGSQVTLADFLGIVSSTIGWVADILAYQQLINPGQPSPTPPLPPFEPSKTQTNTAASISNNINGLDFDIPQNKDDLTIYLLLIILSSLNQNN